ncbi:hypothetical protein OKA05_01960 [Luteolibacter arcticus]|uniref:Uncharacterized protein n=1 Tax=Luteolibacter arcticus TaxID=1581411 RepID=A0ABT3GCD6_9BACT|nr:hypothetical protein [Luteolibacter arcticus]MCW1921297.1 hypothetical protein [Luteolibacter arcticus]
MKTITIFSFDSDDEDRFDEEGEWIESIEIEHLRALLPIVRRKGSGPEICAVETALNDDELSAEQLDYIRRLETEFAREIAEFMAKRRPLREVLADGTEVTL